jgi:hypothetical protein
MKKITEQKAVIVFLAVAGLSALALLSAALRDLTFSDPEPFSFDLSALFVVPTFSAGQAEISGWRYIIFAALAAVIIGIIALLLDPELRKRVLKRLLRTALSLALIFYALNYAFEHGRLKNLLEEATAAASSQPGAVINAANPVFTQPKISPWLVFGVSFAIGLALVLIGWYFYSRQRRYAGRSARVEMAGIAREALDGLQPGRNWDDAIVRAYVRMNEVVVADRQLVRQPGSTPSEFAQRMERIGLPGEAVRVLIGLFEGVRYGSKTSSAAERDQAAAALSAILHACGRSQ